MALTLIVTGGATAILGACSVGSAPTKASKHPVTLPTEVVGRIEDSSDIPVALWTRSDLKSKVLARVITVGDIAAGDLSRCALFAQESVDAIERITGIRPNEKYLMLLPRNGAEFKNWIAGSSKDVAGGYVPPGPPGAQGWIVIDTASSIGTGRTLLDNRAWLEHDIRHEFFHANTLPDSDSAGNAPLWVTEGYAEWAGSTATVVFPQAAPPPNLPATNSEFAQERATNAYAQSFMFVSYLVSQFGQATAIRFYKRSLEPAYGSTAASFAHVFKRDLASVEKEWASQYKEQVAALDVDVYVK
ncbi:gluzincin family metallopeptidase [Flexivirga lutea]